MSSVMKFYSVGSWLKNLWPKGKEATIRLLYALGRLGRGIRWGRFGAKVLKLFTVLLSVAAVILALITLIIDLEDRQSHRIFRAWEVVFDAREILAPSKPQQEQAVVSPAPDSSLQQFLPPPPTLGSGVRQALQFLNRDFEGWWCGYVIGYASQLMTGNPYRKCVFPRKKQESFKGLRLPRIDISGARLPGADLTGADLTGANLTGVDLTGATLRQTTFTDATLTKAILAGADLTSATLTSVDLTEVENLAGTTLADATLIGVNLAGVTLIGTDLARAVLTDATLFDITLTGVDLKGALLTGADLARAVLTGVDLKGALLTGADLREARLTGVDLTGVDLTGVDLTGAILIDVDLTDATLDLVDMRGTKLDGAQLSDVRDDRCVWHDATGPTQSWAQPADGCRERLLKFLTKLACQDRLTAEAVVQKYVDISQTEEQIPPRILDPTEVARALLETDFDGCPTLDPYREDLRNILPPETVATEAME